MAEKQVSLYIDAHYTQSVNVDDFIVAIGKKQSNSVYHIAEVKVKRNKKRPWVNRHNLKAFRSDLLTALQRDSDQQLIPMTWYKR